MAITGNGGNIVGDSSNSNITFENVDCDVALYEGVQGKIGRVRKGCWEEKVHSLGGKVYKEGGSVVYM